MTQTLSITEARSRLLEIAERLEREPSGSVQITKRGKRILTMISAEAYDSILETLEICADERAMSELRKALREIARGRAVPWEEARRKLIG